MRSRFAFVIIAGVVVLFPACATRGSLREVSARVDQMVKDMDDLRLQQGRVSTDTAATLVEVRTASARLRDTESRLRDTHRRFHPRSS